jgi:hypothetical protein
VLGADDLSAGEVVFAIFTAGRRVWIVGRGDETFLIQLTVVLACILLLGDAVRAVGDVAIIAVAYRGVVDHFAFTVAVAVNVGAGTVGRPFAGETPVGAHGDVLSIRADLLADDLAIPRAHALAAHVALAGERVVGTIGAAGALGFLLGPFRGSRRAGLVAVGADACRVIVSASAARNGKRKKASQKKSPKYYWCSHSNLLVSNFGHYRCQISKRKAGKLDACTSEKSDIIIIRL